MTHFEDAAYHRLKPHRDGLDWWHHDNRFTNPGYVCEATQMMLDFEMVEDYPDHPKTREIAFEVDGP